MIERVLTQLFQKMNPGRKAIAKRVGNRLVFVTQDSAGCNDYLLEGTYTYDEVVKLNELTTYNAGFGFCKGIGPVAFIGILNPAYAWIKNPNKCNRSNSFAKSETRIISCKLI